MFLRKRIGNNNPIGKEGDPFRGLPVYCFVMNKARSGVMIPAVFKKRCKAMKRTLAIILLLGLLASLCACGGISAGKKPSAGNETGGSANLPLPAVTSEADQVPPAEAITPEEPSPESIVFSEANSKAETVYDANGIEITRYDFSLYDKEGILLVELWYDLVQLSGDSYRYSGVNYDLRKGLADYIYSLNASYVQDTIAFAEEMKASAESEGWGWSAFYDTVSADVKEFDEDIFSVALFTDWYMGGVHNFDADCVNYDLRSGTPVTLERISSTLGPGTDLMEFIRAKANAMTIERDMEPIYPVDLRLEDLEFYLENRELILYFNTYQLGSGAYGSFPVPTGILLDPGQNNSFEILGRTWSSTYHLSNYRTPVFSWLENESVPYDSASTILYRELTIGTDGSFSAIGADDGFGQHSRVTGTCTFEENGSLARFFYTDSNGQGQNAAYFLARIGDCIQLTQLQGDIFGYGSPLLTVFTLQG